ncbi:MAG: transposase family protein [Anaerolineae bacterium]
MQKYIPRAFEIDLQLNGFMFEMGSLFEALCGLHDQRDARGLRDSLTTVLSYLVLAKLAGENHLRGIAQWVDRRKEQLADFFGLAEPQAAPCDDLQPHSEPSGAH